MKKSSVAALLLAGLMTMTAGLAGCSSAPSAGPISDENVEVSKYYGIEVLPVEKTEVTDDIVESTIQSKLGTDYEKVDREAQNGDQVDMNFVGKLDGEAFDGGSADNAELVLGSGTYIGASGDYKGFEEQIEGHKAGETFDIEVQFPEDYTETLAGKVATFTITLNEVREGKAQELTDEVVATLSATSKNVEEYRAEIKAELESEYEESYNSTLKQEVYAALINNTTILGDLQSDIDQAYDDEYAYYESYAQMYGMEMEDFCQSYTGMSLEDFEAAVKADAESTVKYQKACQLIAKEAGLELSDQEFQEKGQALAEEYGYTDQTADTAAEESTAEEESTGAEEATTETLELKTALEQFIDAYGEDKIRNYFTEEAVMEYLMKNCVQTEDATSTEAAEATSAAEEATTEE